MPGSALDERLLSSQSLCSFYPPQSSRSEARACLSSRLSDAVRLSPRAARTQMHSAVNKPQASQRWQTLYAIAARAAWSQSQSRAAPEKKHERPPNVSNNYKACVRKQCTPAPRDSGNVNFAKQTNAEITFRVLRHWHRSFLTFTPSEMSTKDWACEFIKTFNSSSSNDVHTTNKIKSTEKHLIKHLISFSSFSIFFFLFIFFFYSISYESAVTTHKRHTLGTHSHLCCSLSQGLGESANILWSR